VVLVLSNIIFQITKELKSMPEVNDGIYECSWLDTGMSVGVISHDYQLKITNSVDTNETFLWIIGK
jgi:hypothetical protein